MKVKSVMHSGIAAVALKTPISEIAKKMRDEDVGAIPVAENGQLVGMVTDRDLACRALANGHDISKLKASDAMSCPIFYCQEDDDVEYAISVMEHNKVRRLPVIDHNKQMVGMLSLGDISHKLPQEVAGDVIRAVSGHHA